MTTFFWATVFLSILFSAWSLVSTAHENWRESQYRIGTAIVLSIALWPIMIPGIVA